MGLPDLASDGSPLFAEPMFLFGWALCNTSTYCMLTFWLSCVNYALRGEFPLLYILLQDIFTYALFLLPGVNLSLKNQLPYYIISFSWNKRLLEQSSYAMNVPLTFIIFLAKVTALFLKWKRISFLSIHRHWSLTCSTTLYCAVVVHRKELVKLSSPPLQFTFNKKKMKSFKKVKLVYLRMLVR